MFRVAGLYVVAAWLIIQVAETLLPIFETPDWVLKVLVALLAIGFLPALVFAWVFELTPEGLRRESDEATQPADRADPVARRLDLAVIALLIATIALTAWHRSHPPAAKSADHVAATSADIGPQATLGPHSVAVLPFENFSAEASDALFADGLADTVLHQLAQLRQIKVIARNSSFAYKGSNVDVRKVGAELGVASVLEGSVQRQGERIRVIAQLVETRDGSHLWSQTYDRPISDLFAIQDEIAQAVVKALAVELLEGETGLATAPANPAAHALMLEARALGNTRTTAGRRTLAVFTAWRDRALEAVRADPGYIESWLELADAEQGIAFIDSDTGARAAAIERGYAALRRALAIDPGSQRGLALMGWLLLRENRPVESLAVNLSVLEPVPNDVGVMRNAGLALMLLGRPEEALVLQERALALDPLSGGGIRQRGGSLMMLGRFDEARGNHEAGIERYPGLVHTYADLATMAGLSEGDWATSTQWLFRGLDANANDPILISTLVRDLALLGLGSEADRFAARLAGTSNGAGEAQVRVRRLASDGLHAEALTIVRNEGLEADAQWLQANRSQLALICLVAADEACARRHLSAGLAALNGSSEDLFSIQHRQELGDAVLLGLVAHRLGDSRGTRLMRMALEKLRTQPAMGPHSWQEDARFYGEAELLAALGENAAALDALRAAVPTEPARVRLLSLADVVITDSPFLDGLREDPAFREWQAEIERRRSAVALEVKAVLAKHSAD